MSCGAPKGGVPARGAPRNLIVKASPVATEFRNDTRFLKSVPARIAAGLLLCASLAPALGAGTRAGTLIESTATVDFDMNGTAESITSNTVSFQVAERIDVVVTLQSGQVVVAPNDVDRGLLFTVTNTGNGDEAFTFAMDSLLGGDDFDPIPTQPDAIYFDTDGSGDFSTGDVAYVPGGNEPVLAPDQAVDVLLVNDIPGNVANAEIGRSQLTATAATGSGAAGTVLAGLGDGGIDAVVGTTGALAAVFGEYVVDDVAISVLKAQSVLDPSGGTAPVTGAIITYTITVEVTSAGVATAAAVRDAIPTWSTFVPASITLNGNPISDAIDADAGEFDTSTVPSVVVRLGDLTQGDGVQTVIFQVQID